VNGLLDWVALTIAVFVQWRITVTLLRAADRRVSGRRRRAVRSAIWVFTVAVAVGYGGSSSELVVFLGLPARIAMLLGAVALGYLMTATAVYVLYLILNPIRRHLGAEFSPARRRALNTTANLMMAAPFAVMGYGALVGRSNFGVRELDVPIAGLPKDLDGVRILQLSDIHLSAFLSEAELARVIDTAIELRPHLAVVTGDLITSQVDPLNACIRQLARLKTDAGVFGCMGNHERYAGAETHATEAGARAGILFLRQQRHSLRFGNSLLNLAGVDYQPLSNKQAYLRGAERLVEPGAVNILLSHNPDVLPVAAQQGYNLVLAGHTHGGQVTVEILDQSINPARFFTPYVYGLYRSGTAAVYVTRGIGTIGIPARIGAPPEISVLRLRKA
jgi:predicted MPP superfamily phosphohydrolase